METNFILTDIKPTSQAHCWQLLLEGYALKHKESISSLALLRKGTLVGTDGPGKFFRVDDTLSEYSNYKVYKAREWTDLLEDGPILCTAIYLEDKPRVIIMIDRTSSYKEDDEWIYQSSTNSFYKDAKPVTLEELKPYLLEYRTGLLK